MGRLSPAKRQMPRDLASCDSNIGQDIALVDTGGCHEYKINRQQILSMTPISRRKFMEKAVISSGAAGFLAASASDVSAAPLGLPIGSQVWPTRSMIKDFPAYVKRMAGIGVTRLELCSPLGYGEEFSSLANGKEVARILADHGMKSESSHFSMGEL